MKNKKTRSKTKFSFYFFLIIYKLNKTFLKNSVKYKAFLFLLFKTFPNFTKFGDKKSSAGVGGLKG